MNSKILLTFSREKNQNAFKLSKMNFNNNQNIPIDNSIKEPKDSIIKNYFFNTDIIANTNNTSITTKIDTPITTLPSQHNPNHGLGLENIGATCYMNATLQCLSNIKSFKNYFQNREVVQKDINNRNGRLSNAFVELVNKIWENTYETYYAPYNFKNLISELNPLFRGVQANDSKDLIIFIYETLHTELNNPNSDNKILAKLNNENIPNDLKIFRQNYYSQNYSIITNIFYAEQTSNLACYSCQCNKVSYNIYNFLIFPLEKIRLYLIKKNPNGILNVTLYDCFEQNEEKELLSGPNQIYCNNCRRQSNALSFNKLYNCPEVLTIILNRGKGLEFSVEFDFPMILNIENYVIDKKCGTKYDLIGVLTHLGESGMSGHFIAYCKSPIDSK